MENPPLISIVTPSFNQGNFLGETLQSLVDQNYPRLEVIIQDGGSTDDSIAIAGDFARRFPAVFQVFVEKDSGQADALNRGFARAKGEILGFLNSDDTLYPGCLLRVAKEIDPRRNRWIVFGRCLFTGEGSPYVGIEHPAEYKSHFEQLAIWKRGYNTLPQPSVFWHRRVWEKCGGLNTAEHHVLDYDLFCRFSSHFRFHRVDELWSTYRMHAVSKSSQRTEAEV
ncbi:MAG TPA: glycosyltransferase family 2 protein, partial [Candidatus Didemnitutus sp.]|nr:glycosyltransferase family 2 protein [Candidatus Didemnitutus sp.]